MTNPRLRRMTDREYYWNCIKLLVRYAPHKGKPQDDISGTLVVIIAVCSLLIMMCVMGWLSHP